MSPLTNILIKQLACTAPVPSPLSPTAACLLSGRWLDHGWNPSSLPGHAVMLGAEALVTKPQESSSDSSHLGHQVGP